MTMALLIASVSKMYYLYTCAVMGGSLSYTHPAMVGAPRNLAGTSPGREYEGAPVRACH